MPPDSTDSPKPTKSVPRNAAELGSLDLFARLDVGTTKSLADASRIGDVLHVVREGLERSLSTESRVRGWHAERMFGEVLKALGKCSMIKEEDQGTAWGPDVIAPDYRAVVADGRNLLIEVKNHYQPRTDKPFSLRSDYVSRLRRYASLANGTLKFAIYWAYPSIWTLIDPDVFTERGNKVVVDLPTAFAENEMGIVGDMMLATVPPLSITMQINEDVSQFRRDPDGSMRGTVRIKGASIEAKGRTLTQDDARLASYILMFSDWQEKMRSVVEADTLRAIVLDFEPEEWDRAQGFASLGFLSQFFSRQFWLITTNDGEVNRLHADLDPGAAGFVLAREYKSADFPLWRFVIAPKSSHTSA